MRLWPRRWHAETWVCSLRGHIAPARFAAELTPADRTIGVEVGDGERMARCLRCDCWIEHRPPSGDEVKYAHIPPLDQIRKPRRGEQLNEAIVMRLIALNKALHALTFTLLAITLQLVRANFSALQTLSKRMLDSLQGSLNDTGQGASHSWLSEHLESVLHLRTHTVLVLTTVAVTYAVIEWTEAIGLWLERRWAEYLTVLATAGFLPLEIHELLNRVTVLRVVALVVNVVLLVWLVWKKRLFGIGGGLHAEQTDWPAVLAAPSPSGVDGLPQVRAPKAP